MQMEILEIINCNNKVFVPNAKVECAIVIYRKCIDGDNSNVKITDYSDDGYKILKKIRYYDHKPICNYQYKCLRYDSDWNYCKEYNNELTNDELFVLISEYNNAFKYAYNNYLINQYKINKLAYKPLINDVIVFKEIKEWKKYTISPLITRSGKNNGITEYINDYSVESGYFTIAPSGGSTGHCFYHPYPVAVDGLLKILKLNESVNINPHLIALLITYNLTKKYSYTNRLTINKLMNEVINIPIFA